MSRPRMEISSEIIERARQLRAGGTSWFKIGNHVGLHENTIRERLDPAFAASKRFRYTGPASFIRAGEERVSVAEAARALASVPPDTRTAQARLLGDPLPGRSALDLRKRMGATPP